MKKINNISNNINIIAINKTKLIKTSLLHLSDELIHHYSAKNVRKTDPF